MTRTHARGTDSRNESWKMFRMFTTMRRYWYIDRCGHRARIRASTINNNPKCSGPAGIDDSPGWKLPLSGAPSWKNTRPTAATTTTTAAEEYVTHARYYYFFSINFTKVLDTGGRDNDRVRKPDRRRAVAQPLPPPTPTPLVSQSNRVQPDTT